MTEQEKLFRLLRYLIEGAVLGMFLILFAAVGLTIWGSLL